MNGAKNNLKTYQGQEFTEDLGLNTHEWRYRISDPAIGRFWQIDPLAEDYVYNSTYAFQENKMGMGVELEGLELGGLFKERTGEATKKVNKSLNDLGNNFTTGEARRQLENGLSTDPLVEVKNEKAKNEITEKAGNTLKENIGKATKGAVMTMTEEVKEITGHSEDAIVVSSMATGGATLPALPYVKGADLVASGVQITLFLSEGDTDGALNVGKKLIVDETIDKVTKKIPGKVASPETKEGVSTFLGDLYDYFFEDDVEH